ncbi:hypothetical protein R6Q59_023129 [Mikania micrantha]
MTHFEVIFGGKVVLPVTRLLKTLELCTSCKPKSEAIRAKHVQIGGYNILPGTKVLICIYGIAKDPRVWTENAKEFYPERFENRGVDQFDMAPFGGGRRSCPRYNLATSTIEVVVANLFNNIDWKPPNGMRNEDLEDEDGSLLVAKKTPLCLVTVKHNSQA